MATNEGWPEAFGFSLSHGSPCVVSWTEEGGSAQRAGLQCGDVLVQVDGEDVREWRVVDVIERARMAKKVPPSLLVKSAVLLASLPRLPEGFGVTFRGDAPVYIRSVDFGSAGWEAGLRSGDLLLEVNSINIRYSSKRDVLQLIDKTGGVLTVGVVSGGLHNETAPTNIAGVSKNKSKLFHDKVNYFLHHDEQKKLQLLTILKVYNKNRDLDSLCESVDILLDTPIERRLIRDIRGFLLPNHLPRYDALLSFEPNRALSRIHRGLSPSPLVGRSITRSKRSDSLPNIHDDSLSRLVVVSRDPGGGYGFSLSGNAPVFIRSVDTASPAALAGLNPMDYLLEINGTDVRTGTHSHVLRLLGKGGAKPRLLVSQQPPVWDAPEYTEIDGGHTHSDNTYAHLLPETRIGTVEDQSRIFRRKMNELLPKEDCNSVTTELKRYSQQRDLPELVDRLSGVITDRRKSVLFHYICQMLPEDSQLQFDNLAATKLAKYINRHDIHPVSSLATASQTQSHAHKGHAHHDYTSSSEQHSSSDEDTLPQNGRVKQVGGAMEDTRTEKKTRKKRSKKRNDSMATRPLPPIPNNDSKSSAKNKGAGSSSNTTPLLSTPITKSVPTTPTISIPPPPPPPGAPPPPPPPAPPPPLAGSLPIGSNRPKTKRVNWDKLQGQSLEGTIWRELSGLEEALEYCKLEEQFSTVPAKATDTIGKGVKDKKQSVLEPRKAYNIGILMGHLKMSTQQVKKAVLSCDTEVLSDASLSQMEAFAPDKRECLAFVKYHKDHTHLGPADQFTCEMSTIPYYSERLRALIYKEHFRERYEEIKSDLEVIVSAALSLQNSKKLRKILEIVLKIGNFLNVGAGKSPTAAQGFRIQFLSQLKDLKTTDRKSTLIHYLYTMAEQKYPQILNFPKELSAVMKAARVSGETLELEVSEAKAGLTEVKHTLNDIAMLQDTPPEDRFVKVMTPFVSECERNLSHLVQLYSEMRIHYNRVAKFFSEDPAATHIDEFFGSFATFVVDFEKVERDINAEREREALRQKQKEDRARWSSRRGSSLDEAEQQEGVVDLRGELARRVAVRNSQVATGDQLTPPTVDYDRETFF